VSRLFGAILLLISALSVMMIEILLVWMSILLERFYWRWLRCGICYWDGCGGFSVANGRYLLTLAG
jgi:hypothetical protein